MENPISISNINDYIFCPVSIYYHNLYGNVEVSLYQREEQLSGTISHESVDHGTYSTCKNILQGISVYSDKYNLVGKIDILDTKANRLIERKRKVTRIYDGYIFQLYAQYFSLKEMGYRVDELCIHSILDNRTYHIELPEGQPLLNRFESLLKEMGEFNTKEYVQTNKEKCKGCIYVEYCDRSLSYDQQG